MEVDKTPNEGVEMTPSHNNNPNKSPKLFNVTLAVNNLTVTKKVFKSKKPFHGPLTAIGRAAKTVGGSLALEEFSRVKNVNTVINGDGKRMVLVVGGPADGTSTFLKALGNRLPITPNSTISINGVKHTELEKERELVYNKIVTYSDQRDNHIAYLTIRETLDFASALTNPNHYDPNADDHASVDKVINLLGLQEAANTLVGNEHIKGASGGQVRRLTLGESIVAGSAVVLADSYTDGLDSSTSLSITQSLKKWTEETGKIIVATLKQPQPEVFSLFDHVIVLKDGQVIYDGPNGTDLESYFEAMGFKDSNMDLADFIIEVLTQPRSSALKTLAFTCVNEPGSNENCKPCQAAAPVSPSSPSDLFADERPHQHDEFTNFRYVRPTTITTSVGELAVTKTPCVTTEQMVEFYHNSPYYKNVQMLVKRCLPDATFPGKDYTTGVPSPQRDQCHNVPITTDPKRFRLGYTASTQQIIKEYSRRFLIVSLRDKPILFARLINAVFMCLLFGTVFWNIQGEEVTQRVGELLLSTLQLSFSQMINIPTGLTFTAVAHKQINNKFYSTPIFVFLNFLLALPFSLVETIINLCIVYFMTGAAIGVKEIFLYIVIIFLQSAQLVSLFNAFTVTQNTVLAQLAVPVCGFFMVLSGIFLFRSAMPAFISHSLYFISPFAWSIRALMNIEYLAPKYDEIIPNPSDPSVNVRMGDAYLQLADMWIGSKWIWAAALVLIGITIGTLFIHMFFLQSKYHEESQGTERNEVDDEIIDPELVDIVTQDNSNVTLGEENRKLAQQIMNDTNDDQQGITINKNNTDGDDDTGGAGGAPKHKNPLAKLQKWVPMVPSWLTFENIKYTVKVPDPSGKGTTDRVLLQDISGLVQPGKLLSLLGSSGAGKTTLLNVLALKANSGVVDGTIKLNGQPLTSKMTRYIGFVEQFDTLYGFSTVRETLLFAARLRLSTSIPDSAKNEIVDEILNVLNLENIKDQLIGDYQLKNLSFAQRKLVSIGLELVSSPSILFLDEPTTGLDSKSALSLMKIIRKLAYSGIAIICTIHQPNSSIFLSFNRLLLLAPGGYLQYLGEIGPYGKDMAAYLSSANSKITPMQPKMNPSVWMLDELSKFDRQGHIELSTQFKSSTNFKRILKRISRINSLSVIDPKDAVALGECQRKNQVVYQEFGFAGANATDEQQQPQQDPATNDEPNLTKSQSVTVLPSCTVEMASQTSSSPALWTQFYYLFWRNSHGYLRNPFYVFTRVAMVFALSVCFGLLYLQLDPSDMILAISLLSGTTIGPFFAGLLHAATAVPWQFSLRPVMTRETQDGYYRAALWLPTNLILEIISVAIAAIIVQQPLYFLVGLPNDGAIWAKYLLALFGLIMTFISTALMLGAVVSSATFAQLFLGVYFCLGFVFSGLALTLPQIPKPYVWLYKALTMGYSLEAVVNAIFSKKEQVITIFMNGESATMPVNTFIAQYIGIEYGDYWLSLLWVLLYNIGMLIVAGIASTWLRFIKK